MSKLEELEILKLQKLILLGDEVHYQVRTKAITDPKLCEISNEIVLLDKELYACSGVVIHEKGDGICPSCHIKLEGDVKFCGSCGTNIEEFYSKDTIHCVKCNNIIDVDDNYCPVCGNKKED